jgi:hypothetical protein
MENKTKFAFEDERHILNPFLDKMPETTEDIIPKLKSQL